MGSRQTFDNCKWLSQAVSCSLVFLQGCLFSLPSREWLSADLMQPICEKVFPSPSSPVLQSPPKNQMELKNEYIKKPPLKSALICLPPSAKELSSEWAAGEKDCCLLLSNLSRPARLAHTYILSYTHVMSLCDLHLSKGGGWEPFLWQNTEIQRDHRIKKKQPGREEYDINSLVTRLQHSPVGLCVVSHPNQSWYRDINSPQPIIAAV